MPRLSGDEYINRHNQLRRAWLHYDTLFRVLPPTGQWLLHRFYRPAEELSRAALLEHRQAITAEEPTLPSDADKAYRRVHRVYQQALLVSKGDGRRFYLELTRHVHGKVGTYRKRRIRVSGLVRPQIDEDAYAQAVGSMLLEELEKERKRKQQSQDTDQAA